jgi:hypothetical protein
VQPNITEREAQPYAGIPHALEREKLSDFVPGSLNKAFGFLQKHRLNTPGAPVLAPDVCSSPPPSATPFLAYRIHTQPKKQACISSSTTDANSSTDSTSGFGS